MDYKCRTCKNQRFMGGSMICPKTEQCFCHTHEAPAECDSYEPDQKKIGVVARENRHDNPAIESEAAIEDLSPQDRDDLELGRLVRGMPNHWELRRIPSGPWYVIWWSDIYTRQQTNFHDTPEAALAEARELEENDV